MPDTVSTYDKSLMAASLLPIYEDAEASVDPELTINLMQKVYDAGENQWNSEAKELFNNQISRYRKVSGVNYDLSFLDDYTPPSPNPSKSEEENIRQIDDWKKNTLESFDKEGDSSWYTIRDLAEKNLDDKARGAKQQVTWDNSYLQNDKLNRGLNALAGAGASALPWTSEATVKDYATYFDTNPETNEDESSRIASAIGQGGLSVAAPAIAGLATGVLAGPVVGAAVWTGLGVAINGSLAYRDTYNNILESTGDPSLAMEIGFKRVGSETLLESAGDALVATKILGPWFKALSSAKQAKIAGLVLNKTTTPIRSKLLGIAEDTATATGTEYVTETSQSLAQQVLEEPYTGKEVSLDQALQEGKYGAISGFVFGGGASTVTHVFSPNYSPKKVSDVLIKEAEKGNTISEDGQSLENEQTGDFDKPVNSALFELDEVAKKQENSVNEEDQAAVASGLGSEKQAEKNLEEYKQQIESDKNATPITESQQPEIQQQLELFANDKTAQAATIKGVKESEIPAGSLTAASIGTGYKLKAENSSIGVVVTKKPIIPEAVETEIQKNESEQEVSPNAEEEERINLYPNKITQLKNRLSRVPSKAMLLDRMKKLPKAIVQKNNLLKQVWGIVDPNLRNLKKNKIRKEIASLKKMLDEAVEQYYDYDTLIEPEKVKIQKEIEEMQLKYDLARDFIGRPSHSTEEEFTDADLLSVIELGDISNEEITAKEKELNDRVDILQGEWEAASSLKPADEQSAKDLKAGEDAISKQLDEAIKEKEHFNKLLNYLKHSSTEDAVNALAMRRMLEKPSKTQEKESKGKESTTKVSKEVKLDPKQYITESRSTGAAFTSGISSSLRNTINYWLGGFGIRDVLVMTSDEFNSGAFNKLFSAPIRKLVKDIQDNNDLQGTGGVMHTNKEGTVGIMILKDGSFDKNAFIKASHETGHAIERMLLQNAPESVKNKILKEFHEAVSKVENNLANKKSRLTVGMVADQMMGVRADNSPYSSDRLFKSIRKTPDPTKPDAPYKDYLIGKDPVKSAGLSEFKANQAARFLYELGLNPNLKASNLYENLALMLHKIWKSIADRFSDAPSLRSWLNDHWSEQRASKMFYPAPKETNAKGEPNYVQEIRKIKQAYRIEDAPESSSISSRLKRLERMGEYEVQHHGPILRKAFDAIHKDGIENILQSYLEKNNNKIPVGERTLWASEILNELERLEAYATKIKDKKVFADLQNQVYEIVDLDNRASGRLTEANKVLVTHTLVGRSHYLTNELNHKANSIGIVPPFEFNKVREIVSKYFESEKAAPDGIYRNKLLKEELNEVNEEHGNPAQNWGWTWWYGNILSGISTQWANIQFSSLDVFLGKPLASFLAHPSYLKYIHQGMLRGLSKGFTEALGAWRGSLLRNIAHTRVEALVKELPRVSYKGHFYSKPINWIVNSTLKLQQYIPFRALAAVDVFWRRVGTELQIHQAAVEALNKTENKYNSEQLASLVSDMLHNGDSEWESALIQAKEDWDKIKETFKKSQIAEAKKAKELGKSYKIKEFPNIEPSEHEVTLRALEIIDSRRNQSNSSVYQEGERAGLRSNLTNDPEGIEGVIADSLKHLVKKVPSAKLVFPFINVTSNIMYRVLDYSPVGVIRGIRGRSFFNPRMKEKIDPKTGLASGKEVDYFSSLESRQKIAEGLLGSVLFVGAMGLAAEYADDDDPYVALYARGPKDKGKKEQWLSEGNIPYSFKVGKLRYKFAETPAALVLGIAGEFWDAYRWDKSFNRKERPQQFAEAVGMAFRVGGEMGVLKSVKDFLESLMGDRSLKGTIISSGKGLIPFSGLLRDIAKFTDDYKVDPTSAKAVAWSGIPYATRELKKDLNAFGEAIPKAGRFTSWSNEDATWRFLARNGLSIPSVAPTIVVGSGSGKEKDFYRMILRERESFLGRVAYDILTPDENYELQLEAGKNIKNRVKELVRPGTVKNKVVYQQAIDKIVEEERRKAKMKVLINTHKKFKKGEFDD